MAIAVIGAFLSLRSNGTFGAEPHVTAEVADAGGALRTGSDVKLKGAIIGRVAAIERGEDAVRLDLEMSGEDLDKVPANVVARILPATVFGTTYVDLVVHGEPSADALAGGDLVRADSTQGTLELQQALDDIDRLVKALGPRELAAALGATATALAGRGEQIGRTVRTANSYLERLNPLLPQVKRDLDELADAADVVDAVAPDLLDATDDVLVTLNTVVTQEASLTALISGGTRLARAGSRFLDANQTRLVRFISNSSALLDVVYDNRRAGITDAIAVNIALGDRLPSTIREGFVQTDGILRLAAPGFYSSAERPTYGRSDAGMTAMLGGGR